MDYHAAVTMAVIFAVVAGAEVDDGSGAEMSGVAPVAPGRILPGAAQCQHFRPCQAAATPAVAACGHPDHTGLSLMYQAERIDGTYCGTGLWGAVCCDLGATTPCASNQFFHEAAGKHECRTTSMCGPGELQIAPPTSTTDRECAACPAGTFRSDASHAFVECHDYASCVRGTFVSFLGNATHDSECSLCLAGTYNDFTRHANETCLPYPSCGCGTFKAFDVTSIIGSPGACHPCSEDTFQVASGHLHTECTPRSGCGPGTRVDSAARASSPCTDDTDHCLPCARGFFQSNDGFSESTCTQLWSAGCALGTFAAAEPSATADWQCAQCAGGFYQDQPNSQRRECLPFSLCDAGYGVRQNDSAVADRSCDVCEPGVSFRDTEGVLCDAVTPCPPSTYVGVAGTSTTDQVCVACPDGTFAASFNEPVCHAISPPCNTVSEIETTAPSRANDRVCELLRNCPPGAYSVLDASGTESCAACPEGLFSTFVGVNNACLVPLTCPPGTFESVPPADTHDRSCMLCATGFYTTEENAPECTPVRAACPAGEMETVTGTPTSDVVCVPFTRCQPGEYVTQMPGPRLDRQCSPCAERTYSTAVNQPVCTAQPTCAPGEFIRVLPTPMTEQSCEACPSGYFTNASNLVRCHAATICLRGEKIAQASNSTSNSLCAACEPNRFSTVANARSCYPASPPCRSGFEEASPQTPTADRVCRTCPGTATPIFANGQWTCSVRNTSTCIAGTYISAITATSRTCAECPAGTYSVRTNARECEPWTNCLSGTNVAVAPTTTSDRQCEVCIGGQTFTESANEVTCKPVRLCADGEFEVARATSSSNRRCAPCNGSTFRPLQQALAEHAIARCTRMTSCRTSEFASFPGSTTANRICSPITICATDSLELTPPTPTTDRICTVNVCLNQTTSPCGDAERCAAVAAIVENTTQMVVTCTAISTTTQLPLTSNNSSPPIDVAAIALVFFFLSAIGIAIAVAVSMKRNEDAKGADTSLRSVTTTEYNPALMIDAARSPSPLKFDMNGRVPSWYLGNTIRQLCSQVVMNGPTNSFVVRAADSGRKFELIVNDNGPAAHFIIDVADDGKCTFGQAVTLNIHDMIDHLQSKMFIGEPLDGQAAFEQSSTNL